jgi:hypothetical protein
LSHPAFVIIVGKLRSCKAMSEAAETDARTWNAKSARDRMVGGAETVMIPVLGGPCHYSSGPVIFVSQYKVFPTAMD